MGCRGRHGHHIDAWGMQHGWHGDRTCPGPSRTIEPTGGLGMTGTAGSNVVRTGGAIWNGTIHKNPWLEELVLLSLRLTQADFSKLLNTETD